jgi:hypothetical protein
MNNILGDGSLVYDGLGRVRFSHNGSVYIVLGYVSLRCVLLRFDCYVSLNSKIYLQFYSSDKHVILIGLLRFFLAFLNIFLAFSTHDCFGKFYTS